MGLAWYMVCGLFWPGSGTSGLQVGDGVMFCGQGSKRCASQGSGYAWCGGTVGGERRHSVGE